MRTALVVTTLVAFLVALSLSWGHGPSALGPKSLLAGDNQWTGLGLNISSLQDMVASPDFDNDQTLFAVDPVKNEVWLTEDGGQDWHRANPRTVDGPAAVAISPNFATDKTVFLGDVTGVHKSTNRGGSWVLKGRRYGVSDVKSLALSPSYPSDHVVFAGTLDGIYKSTDEGDSWEHKGPNQLAEGKREVRSIAMSPNFSADRTLFVGFKDSGLYKSTDGGDTWVQGWLRNMTVDQVRCSPGFATDRTVFAATPFDGLYRTTNAASGPWQVIEGAKAHSVAVSANYATDRTLYVGKANGVRVSVDGGATFTNTDSEFSEIVYSLVIASNSPRRLYAGTFGAGVYEYTSVLPTPTATLTPTNTATITPTVDVTETPTITATSTASTPTSPPPEHWDAYLPLTLNAWPASEES